MTRSTLEGVPNPDLGAPEILDVCSHGVVPTNTNIEAAIEAHELALKQFMKTNDESAHLVAACALRTVLLSSLRTREQGQRQIDYFTGLPLKAWERVISVTDDPATLRDSVLAMCARCIAMRTDA